MAHLRRPLGAALALNTVVFIVESVAGLKANSLSLMMDAAHNLSDEVAILLLFLAYVMPSGLSGTLIWSASFLNSLGILALGGFLVCQAAARLLHAEPVLGIIPIVAGLIAAVGNYGVAAVLRKAATSDPAIRLAYVHNLGDALVAMAPVAAGLLIVVTRLYLFDPLLALVVAGVLLSSTLRELAVSRKDLLWPRKVACGPHHSG